MPNYYQFRCRETGEYLGPTRVDPAICAYLGVPEDPKRYVNNWNDLLGMMIATGYTYTEGLAFLRQCRGEYLYTNTQGDRNGVAHYDEHISIWNYLWMHYDISAWHSRRLD